MGYILNRNQTITILVLKELTHLFSEDIINLNYITVGCWIAALGFACEIILFFEYNKLI